MESKASSHFINHRFDELKQKNIMTCKHCLKTLIDNKNTTGQVSHLKSCRPNINLTNKVKGTTPNQRFFSVEMASSNESSSSPPSTPKKTDSSQKPETSLKTMMLSHTPYANNSAERARLISLLLQLVVDINLPISTVDHPAFIKYSAGLNNRFRIPCRQTMRSTVIPQKVFNNLYMNNHY